MRIRFAPGLVVFASSYVPLAFILAILDFDFAEMNYSHPWAVIITLCVAALLTPSVFVVLEHMHGSFDVEITALRDRSNELVNYTLPYIVSFLGADLGHLQSIVALVFFLVLMFLLTARTQTVFINPLLALAGYALYDAEFEEQGRRRQKIILSSRGLQLGERCIIQPLSPFMVLARPAAPHESSITTPS